MINFFKNYNNQKKTKTKQNTKHEAYIQMYKNVVLCTNVCEYKWDWSDTIHCEIFLTTSLHVQPMTFAQTTTKKQ